MTGIFTASKDIAAIFGNSPNAKTIPFGLSSMSKTPSAVDIWERDRLTTLGFTHSFEVGEGQYKELENCTWVGNGRFIVEDGGIMLESRVSKLVPSTAMN